MNACPRAGTVIFLGSLLATPAHASEGGVYVAGEGFTLEQAAAQALAQSAEQTPFWIVASGEQARRAASGQATALLAAVLNRGGVVYLCEQDLAFTPPPDTGLGLIGHTGGSGPRVAAPRVGEPPLPLSERSRRLLMRSCAASQ